MGMGSVGLDFEQELRQGRKREKMLATSAGVIISPACRFKSGGRLNCQRTPVREVLLAA